MLGSWLAILCLLVRRHWTAQQHNGSGGNTRLHSVTADTVPLTTTNGSICTAATASPVKSCTHPPTRIRHVSTSRVPPGSGQPHRRLIDAEFGSYVKLSAQVLMYVIQSMPMMGLTLALGWAMATAFSFFSYYLPVVERHTKSVDAELATNTCCFHTNTCKHSAAVEMTGAMRALLSIQHNVVAAFFIILSAPIIRSTIDPTVDYFLDPTLRSFIVRCLGCCPNLVPQTSAGRISRTGTYDSKDVTARRSRSARSLFSPPSPLPRGTSLRHVHSAQPYDHRSSSQRVRRPSPATMFTILAEEAVAEPPHEQQRLTVATLHVDDQAPRTRPAAV